MSEALGVRAREKKRVGEPLELLEMAGWVEMVGRALESTLWLRSKGTGRRLEVGVAGFEFLEGG